MALGVGRNADQGNGLPRVSSVGRILKARLRQYPSAYRMARRVRMAIGSRLPPYEVRGIPGRVHWNDLMLEGRGQPEIEDYSETGRQAVRFILDACDQVGLNLDGRATVLDFGCGHGRVLRFLRLEVGCSVVACDMDDEAVRFCVAEFGARPLRFELPITNVLFSEYDVIWLGSVLTHLDAATGAALVATLASHLRDGGLLAFSTHGNASLGHIARFGAEFARRKADITRDRSRNGVAYVPYPHYEGQSYGLTWHDPARVPEIVMDASRNLQFVTSIPDHWGKVEQDLWAFVSTNI